MKAKRASGLICGLFAAALAAEACSDVGDSSAVPAGDAGTLDDAAPAEIDGTSPGDGGGGPSTGVDSDLGAEVDAPATPADTGTGVEPDAGEPDTSQPDAAVADSAVEDTGAPDSSIEDAGVDAPAVEDAGLDGTVFEDAGLPDAGLDATVGPVDAGLDSGSDAGVAVDAGSPLVPCTTAGQTGCVRCQYNNGASGTLPNATEACTPTEAALVEHDIAAGTAAAPGPDPDGSCYACAAAAGCLDDSEFGDHGEECEDISGGSGAAECEATIACVLQAACATSAVSGCYCGSAPVSGSCAAVGASNAANGACKGEEATGLGLPADDGLDILKNFTSTTLPSGVANNIFQCATSNGCAACLQ